MSSVATIKRLTIYSVVILALLLFSIVFLKYFSDNGKTTDSQQEDEQLPTKIENSYNEVIDLMQKEQYFKVITGANEFIGLYPEDKLTKNVLFYLGESYFRLKQYSDAKQTFEEVIQKYPTTSIAKAAAKRAALIKRMQDEPPQEIQTSNELLDEYEMARTYYSNQDFDGAIAALADFVRKYPESELVGNAFYWIGESYYAKEDYPNAIKSFRTVSTKYPTSEKVKDANQKIQMSSKLVTSVTEARDAYIALYNLYKERQYDNAISGFILYIEKYPNSQYLPNAYYWIGESYYAKADYLEGDYTKTEINFTKALQYLNDVIRKFPNTQKATDARTKRQHITIVRQYIDARNLYLKGASKEAIAAFSSLSQKYPSHIYMPNFLYWLAESYYDDKDYKNAEIYFKRVIAEFRANHKAKDARTKLDSIAAKTSSAKTTQEQDIQPLSTLQKSSFTQEQLEELFSKGEAAFNSSNYKTAVGHFNQIVNSKNNYSRLNSAKLYLAEANFYGEFFEDALVVYRELLAGVESGEVLLNSGFLQSRIDECLENL